jgi:hypothetical protein
MKAMQNLTIVLGICMAFLVLTGAFVFFFTSWPEHITGKTRYWMGILFLLYGVFRAWRLYKQIKAR